MRITLFNRLFLIRSPIKIFPLPSLNTFGLTNRCEDNLFVLFADYDKVEYSVVTEDVNFLQKNYNIGTVITRISSLDYHKNIDDDGLDVGNYHIISFTKHKFPDIKKMLSNLRCDNRFKGGYRFQSRAWVIRIGEKKSIDSGEMIKQFTAIKEIIPGKTKLISNTPLIEFFEKIDNIKLKPFFKRLDKLNNIELINYQTR